MRLHCFAKDLGHGIYRVKNLLYQRVKCQEFAQNLGKPLFQATLYTCVLIIFQSWFILGGRSGWDSNRNLFIVNDNGTGTVIVNVEQTPKVALLTLQRGVCWTLSNIYDAAFLQKQFYRRYLLFTVDIEHIFFLSDHYPVGILVQIQQ